MSSDLAISVRGISKEYVIAHEEKFTTLGEKFAARLKNPLRRAKTERFQALNDVSFDVHRGDVVGIIGRNGAGKSTLLKILSRITMPTAGEIKLYGRVASLLEVGTGFHPELTGRENIFLNGAILGMWRSEISKHFDAIVDFAEVERFLDTPVKRYSSGMYVRLAFAVAAHLNPEILIVDEVLSVGDAEFQKKCLGKMQSVSRSEGRTVLFVSHNMTAVSTLCSSGVLLKKGRVVVHDTAANAIAAYTASDGGKGTSEWVRPEDSNEQPALSLQRVLIDLQGEQPTHLLRVRIAAKSHKNHQGAFVAIDFFDRAGSWIMQAVPQVEPFIESTSEHHDFEVVVELPPLIPGSYSVGVWVGTFATTFDETRDILSFMIDESPTCGRTFPHSPARGYIVPVSHIHA